MSDGTNEQESNVVDAYTIWSLQVCVDGDTWIPFGSHNADAAAALRTYDFREEHYPEEKLRMARTEVTTVVEDVAELREQLKQKDSSPEKSAVQSE